jgi:hypothetical protein
MDCEGIKDLFSAYVEGSSDYTSVAAVQDHIRDCSSCKREIEVFKHAYEMLNTLPEVDPPASFRHDVVMRIARMQHEKCAHSRNTWTLSWTWLSGRLVPARAVAIACVGAALAFLLIRLPQPAYEHFAAMFEPASEISQTTGEQGGDGSLYASLTQTQLEKKREWQERILRRNTLWVTMTSRPNGDGRMLYRVLMAINPKALPKDEVAKRIGAEVYLLKTDDFAPGADSASELVWRGSILEDAPLLVPVIVDKSQGQSGCVNLLITWRFRGHDVSQIVFIPSGNRLDWPSTSADEGLYPALQTLAQTYGVPVIANARLRDRVDATSIGRRGLVGTLGAVLRPRNIDWLYADKALYVDKKYGF